MNFGNYIEKHRQELVESTQEILRIKSVEEKAEENAPFGKGIASALHRTLEIAESLGFKTVNLDGYVGYAEYENSETKEGDSGYVAALGHLDVVPAGDGWTFPPYGAELHDGKIFARGAIDDKGPIMAALYGLKAIKDSGVLLRKPIRIIFGTNEENGSGEIQYYLEKEKPPSMGFTPDADYPIIYAEKGILVFKLKKKLSSLSGAGERIKYIKGGQRPNMVPDCCEAGIYGEDVEYYIKKVREFSEKRNLDIQGEKKGDLFVITSRGKAAHGSTPQLGINAITQMFDLLNGLELKKEAITTFIKMIWEKVGNDVYGEKLGIDLQDGVSGRLTLNIGTVETDEDSITLLGDIRYPVTFYGEKILEKLKKRMDKEDVTMELLAHMKSLYYPKEHPLIQALQEAYTEETKEPAELLVIGGGTYAKAMPNIVAFGPVFPGQPDICHQPDEFISVEDLVKNSKIYANALYRLAK